MADDLVIQLIVPAVEAEVVSEQLWADGATAIEERPAARSGQVLLVAGFPTPAAARSVASAFGARVVGVDPASWRDEWKKFAQPVVVGSLTITPAWRQVPVGPGSTTVEIDPGPCFGSGGHPTTRLLLAELDRRVRPGHAVLDVGTGSGVLAIACAKLGAASVLALDIDPDAVEVTRGNASRNGVGDRVVASNQEIGSVGTAFDLVVANLSAGVLAALASSLVTATRPGGQLLLGGLLTGQRRHVAPLFAAMEAVGQASLDGWEALTLQR